MATISTRINSSGTYLVNGSFDEITTSTIRTTTDTVYARLLDEVTYNTTSPAIKNLIQYTEQLDNAYWIISDVLPVTANATIAPDGTLTADKVTENTATSITHFIRSTGVLISSSTQYTWSIYAKAGERTFIDVALGTASFWVNSSRSATFNLTTGAIVAVSASPLVASITPAGNGWYRCSITATSAATPGMSSNGSVRICNASASNTYNGDGVSGVFLWGGQLEQNSTLTIYQGIAAANTLVTPGFTKREASDGTVYVTESFDEVTGAPVVDSSLVLWLDAGQSASYSGAGTNVLDISASANNGTLIGTIPFNTRDSGGSFSFDGGNNYIGNFATPLVRTGSRTIESWFQISTNAVRMGLAGDRDGTGWIFCVNRNGNGSLSYNHAGAGGAEDFNFAANVPINTWINAAVTYDVASATVTIYMNGNLLGTASSFTPIVPATTPVSYVGWEINSLKFQGKIAATKIYNRALTADEVQQNFNALRRRYNI
jgi:hypothetical protein